MLLVAFFYKNGMNVLINSIVSLVFFIREEYVVFVHWQKVSLLFKSVIFCPRCPAMNTVGDGGLDTEHQWA